MKQVNWSKRDQARAMLEGWAIFNLPRWGEIQRDDSSEEWHWCWHSDADAKRHIASRALEGSTLHQRALIIHAATMAERETL
jgi:hypothetical protein